jgi:hypothetical protein
MSDLMLRARRLRAFRLCLLIAGAVLLSASAVALAADADPSRAPAVARSQQPTFARSSKRGAHGGKVSSRSARCAAAARLHKHRTARKACAVKKAKAIKRSAREPSGSKPVLPTSPFAPVTPIAPSAPGTSTTLVPPVTSTTPVEAVPPAAPVTPTAPFRFFSPTSFWNEELPADAPLDSTSAAVVGAFDAEIAKEEAAKKGPATINTTAWSVPVYTVPAGQPTVKVTQAVEYGSTVNPALQTAWDAVPLPADAQPAAGTDKHLVVWQPSTDKLWEFWRLEKTSTGWQASWGGAMQKASSDSGAYGPEAWPGAQPGWGASASSLSIAGGLITLEDLEKGQINHALAIALPDTRAGVYAAPAQRTDGEDAEPLSLPEGAHLRLDPNLDLATLHLPKLTLMLAEAAQRYGIVVRDTAADVTFYAQDPTPTGKNPYTGAHGYFEDKTPQQLLESFPWSHLQLLKMELHGES